MLTKKVKLFRPTGKSLNIKTMRVQYPTYEHLGLGYLASFLETNGIEAVIADLVLDPGEVDAIINGLSPEEYPLVGIAVTQASIIGVTAFTQKLKERKPEIQITIGGHFPTAAAALLLRDYPSVDSVIRGEGEIPLLELARRIIDGNGSLAGIPGLTYRQGGEIISVPKPKRFENLDELPFPKRSSSRYAYIASSRGCHYNCSYCSISTFFDHTGWRNRSVKNIVDEICELHYNKGYRHFNFSDDNFVPPGPAGVARVKEFCSEIKARGLTGLELGAMMVPASVSEEVIDPLYEIGLRAFFTGVESASAASLARFNKPTTPEINARALDILSKYDELRVEIGFIMFETGSALSDIQANINFLRRYSNYVTFYPFDRLEIYYGTPIYDLLESRGQIFGNYLDPQYEFEDNKVSWLYQVSSALAEEWGTRIFHKVEEFAIEGSQEDFIHMFVIRQQVLRFMVDVLEKLLNFAKGSDHLPAPEESIKLFAPAVNSGFKQLLDSIDR